MAIRNFMHEAKVAERLTDNGCRESEIVSATCSLMTLVRFNRLELRHWTGAKEAELNI